MFTGIIEKTAAVEGLRGSELCVRSPWAEEETYLGQSISVDGCCLTLSKKDSGRLYFHLSPETLAKTHFGERGGAGRVNLEASLKAGDPMDGHIVTGHVDALGLISSVETHADGASKKIWIKIPRETQAWIAPKGSVAINGVSLTVNDVEDSRFSVTLVPYTLEATTWKELLSEVRGDAKVNIEFDILAKYVERAMKARFYAV